MVIAKLTELILTLFLIIKYVIQYPWLRIKTAAVLIKKNGWLEGKIISLFVNRMFNGFQVSVIVVLS